MKSGLRTLLSAVASAAFVVSASAAKLGDEASRLTITDWIKGQPVDVTDGKNIYVVEFWATWCGPCKVSIPQLSAMQKKFKDKGVVIVAISDEGPELVKPFVQSMGSQMDYVVACDTNRQTHAKYPEAYEQPGIPVAFIVSKDKKVLWVGNPMFELAPTLEQVVAGTFDLPAAIKKDEIRAAISEYSRMCLMGDPNAPVVGRKVLGELPQSVDAYVQFALAIDSNQRVPNRDYGLAFEAINRAEKLADGKNAQILHARAACTFNSGKRSEGIAFAKQAIQVAKDPSLLSTVQGMLGQMMTIEYSRMAVNRDPKAAEFGKQVLNELPNQAEAYLQFAVGIVNNQQNPNRDFALANQALDRAEKLVGGKDARLLNLRAICLFNTGKREAGIATAKLAIEACQDPQMLPALENLYLQLSMAEYNRIAMTSESKAKELGRKILDGLPAQVDPLLNFAFSIVRNTQNKHRDFPLALEALDRAEKLSTEEDPRLLYVRALCLFDSGSPEPALTLAKQAVEICKDPAMRPTFQNLVQQVQTFLARNPGATSPAGTPARK